MGEARERQPMHKVLFMCYDFKLGGNAQVLSTILQYLDRDLFDPVLVTYSEERGYPLPQGISDYALRVRGGGGLVRKLAVNFVAVLRLRRVLRKEQPRIVVGMGGMSNWALILAAKLTSGKTPIIIGEHGAGALEYRKDRITSNLMGLLNKVLYPFADRVVAISDGVRKYLVQDLKLPEGKIVSITNPIDIERIQRLSREQVDHPWLVHKDKPVILWAGRIETLKGVHHLIGALERVLSQIDVRLIIVGEGPEQSTVRSSVKRKGLQEKVDFVGFQSNPYRYMSKSSVLAFPSLGGEGLPMVLVEAMACGLPVVSTDCVAGPAEILQNGRCGILVPVGDEESLAKGILSVLTDPPLRERLVSAAARRATDFEPVQVVSSYERLFREVCNASSSGDLAVDPS